MSYRSRSRSRSRSPRRVEAAPERTRSPPRDSRPGNEEPTNRLFVGNLNWQIRKEDLASLFGKYGEVTDVHVANDRETGRSRGFGFVTMATTEQARLSKENLDQSDQQGRPMRVDYANPREARSGGRGGFRGGAGGRGGFGGGGGGDRYNRDADRYGGRGDAGGNSYGQRATNDSYGSRSGGDYYSKGGSSGAGYGDSYDGSRSRGYQSRDRHETADY
jgi:cold-inducible RNA-binding protein